MQNHGNRKFFVKIGDKSEFTISQREKRHIFRFQPHTDLFRPGSLVGKFAMRPCHCMR